LLGFLFLIQFCLLSMCQGFSSFSVCQWSS
jgi:hypothetical protein